MKPYPAVPWAVRCTRGHAHGHARPSAAGDGGRTRTIGTSGGTGVDRRVAHVLRLYGRVLVAWEKLMFVPTAPSVNPAWYADVSRGECAPTIHESKSRVRRDLRGSAPATAGAVGTGLGPDLTNKRCRTPPWPCLSIPRSAPHWPTVRTTRGRPAPRSDAVRVRAETDSGADRQAPGTPATRAPERRVAASYPLQEQMPARRDCLRPCACVSFVCLLNLRPAL